MWIFVQIVILIFAPILFIRYIAGTKISKVLSPVVLAYALGIAIVSFDIFPTEFEVSKRFSEISIMLAIPLLLFTADIKSWFQLAKTTVLSFLLAVVAALFSCIVFSYFFTAYIDQIWYYAAMLTGVYIGGTANLQAVGMAIGAPEDMLALINAVEILCGGIYLLCLTSFVPNLYARFLPKYQLSNPSNETPQSEDLSANWSDWKSALKALVLAILVLAVAIGLTLLIYGTLAQTTFIIIMLTSLSVALSFNPKVRALRGSFELGDYLLLVFCIAVGMRSDFGNIVDHGGVLLVYTALTMLVTVVLHAFVSYLLKIDRDTTIITSTAAIYGPAFIGQVASVLKNRQIVFAGIATSLVGYALGNYCGILVYYLLSR